MVELYKRYRPQALKDVQGQPEAVKVLERMIKDDKVPQFLLFSGPSGCGKTTMAHIMKRHLGCTDDLDRFNLTEIDGATRRGIDDMKQIRSNMRLHAMGGGARVVLIDEAHQLTREAQSALLSATEFTPKKVYFMLCTTDPDKMLAALANRATRVKVKLLPVTVMTKLLKDVAAKENKAKVSGEVVDKIVNKAEGSARKALILLEQVLYLDEEEGLSYLDDPEAQTQAGELCKALLYTPNVKWPQVAKILKNITEEPETVRRIVLGWCNTAMLNGGKNAGRAFAVAQAFQYNYFDSGKAGLAMSAWEVVHG